MKYRQDEIRLTLLTRWKQHHSIHFHQIQLHTNLDQRSLTETTPKYIQDLLLRLENQMKTCAGRRKKLINH